MQVWRSFGMLVALSVAMWAHAQTRIAHWNVVEAGAVPDGSADCGAVFQAQLDAAGQAGGGVVEVPAGRYRVDGVLSVPANVTLHGVFRVPPTASPTRKSATNLTGSVLFAYAGRGSAEGPPFIRLAGNCSAVAGVAVVYPEWRLDDVPPVPYPPCVLSEKTENVGISDCLFLNPYEAIRLVRAHRHNVRNVTGYPSWRGLYVDMCGDIGRIENVHFWPFGVHYKPDDPFCKWVNSKGVAFELARTDWEYVINTFCFGYGVGYKFSESENGSANGNFVGLGADCCLRAVVVEQAQPPGLLIVNGEFVGRWGGTDSVCMEIAPQAAGKVSLSNCSFWGPVDRCVWMRSVLGQFTACGCNFVNWGNGQSDSPAIQLDAGRAIVQGCTFGEDKLNVCVGSNVVSAILTGNQAKGGFFVENAAGKRAQVALNETDLFTEWTTERLSYYRVCPGPGDKRFFRGWYPFEGKDKLSRWSKTQSRLTLPVVAGRHYTLTVDMEVPRAAVSDGTGLYLNGERIALFEAGRKDMIVEIPPVETDRITLEVRPQGWVPKNVYAGSLDMRVLGVRLFSLTMKADGVCTRVFDANTAEFSCAAESAK